MRLLLRSAVTTEAEALASVRLHQPQLLIITDWLESGSVVSCVQTALQEVPGLRVFMIVSQRELTPELRTIEPLLDAMLLESDLGCEEAPRPPFFFPFLFQEADAPQRKHQRYFFKAPLPHQAFREPGHQRSFLPLQKPGLCC